MNSDTQIAHSISPAVAGYEIYSQEEMLDSMARVQIQFQRLGMGWEHPRVVAYLARVSQTSGRPILTRHFLPFLAYKNLADRLEALNAEDV